MSRKKGIDAAYTLGMMLGLIKPILGEKHKEMHDEFIEWSECILDDLGDYSRPKDKVKQK
jgi:hypothetical protein